MTQDQEILTLLQHPEEIGKRVGFKDLGPMHGLWIREMIRGEEDYTLQAHRGSYKSSCLAVAISLLLILYPKRNIIFLRKTDNDVTEISGRRPWVLRSSWGWVSKVPSPVSIPGM